MNNHGPWGAFAPQDERGLGLPDSLKGGGRKQLADYISRSRDADEAYAFLLDALRRRGRPTIVVLYGDHLPALPDVYRQLCFKNGKSPTAQKPIYRAWANFPVPPAPEITSAYLLQGWIAKAASLPLEGPILANAIAGDIAHNPEIPAGDRKRILNGYANIAAAHLEEDVKRAPAEVRSVLFDQDTALNALRPLSSEPASPNTETADSEDLPMRPGSEMSFTPNEGIMRITVRPYMASKKGCADTGTSTPLQFTVQGDGRTIYSASVAQKAFRLATLDLRGTKTITFRMAGASDASGCNNPYVRVVQMQCLNKTCSGPASTGEPGGSVLLSRSLGSDALEGDLAALAAAAVPGASKEATAH
jgi:hypothetical protein